MKKLVKSIFIIMLILSMFPINIFAINLGQKLTSPEEGWKRYDDTDAHITYINSTKVWGTEVNAVHYNNTAHYNGMGESLSFRFAFTGTKIRIIGSENTDPSVSITIDGNTETFSTLYPSSGGQLVLYEKTGLTAGSHNVVITTSGGDKYFGFDAIDIDSSNHLLDYGIIATPTSIAQSNIDVTELTTADVSTALVYDQFSNLMNGGYTLTYFIANTNIATVNGSGLIIAKGYVEGANTTTLTIKYNTESIITKNY